MNLLKYKFFLHGDTIYTIVLLYTSAKWQEEIPIEYKDLLLY